MFGKLKALKLEGSNEDGGLSTSYLTLNQGVQGSNP